MRVLCVLLPHFPLRCEVKRNPDIGSKNTVVAYTVASKKLVLDYSLELGGLQNDMTLQQALSMHGEVELIDADMPYYRTAFSGILDSLEGKSPLVEDYDLGCAFLGLDGLQTIYPDDNALVSAVTEAIPQPFVPQLGIAEGKFIAYLAAKYSPPGSYWTLEDNVEILLSNLPCDVLPLSMKDKVKLQEFGLHTIGQIAALSPGPLQAQFGLEGKRLWELTRGRDDTPFYPRFSQEAIEESTVLSSVTVSLEALLVNFESLLSRVLVKIGPKGIGIRGMTLWTKSWNSEQWQKPIGFKEPVVNLKTIMSRVKQVLENSPQPGPVEQLGIKITGLGYHRGRQKSLFSEVRAGDHLLDNIKQLEFRLGDPQVYKLKEVEPWSRIPERRYILAPVSR